MLLTKLFKKLGLEPNLELLKRFLNVNFFGTILSLRQKGFLKSEETPIKEKPHRVCLFYKKTFSEFFF
jgi:hypothetical protein